MADVITREEDRARRIRELVREWVGLDKCSYVEPKDVAQLMKEAAHFIDAIDDAEIPAKEVGEV